MLENVIIRLNDKVTAVRDCAKSTLLKIKSLKFENFDNAFRRLSIEHQELFTEVIAQEKKKLHRELNQQLIDEDVYKILLE